MHADRGTRLPGWVEQRLIAAADVSSSDMGVYTVVGGLMAVGVVLILIAVWLFRATKPEMELLAPLERMSDRSWQRLDPAMQRRELDQIRPSGARPIERSTRVPSIDEDFDKPVPDLADFDDLTSMQAADIRRRMAAKANQDELASVVAGNRAQGDSVGDPSAASGDALSTGDDTAETEPSDFDVAADAPLDERRTSTEGAEAAGTEPDDEH